MDFESGQSIQLIVALLCAALLFILAYNLPERIVVGLLILLIPFQIISSRYGSLNMVFTYVIGASLLLKGTMRSYPLLGVVAFIFVVYILSFLGSPSAVWSDQFFYLVSIGSNFVLFYLVYNHFARTQNHLYALELLVRMNVLFVIYGLIQFAVGFEQFAFLGIEEWKFAENVEDRRRLVGAFKTPGVTGEYIAMQMLVLAYLLIHRHGLRRKLFLYGLVMANFALLTGTGSRGSFLALLGGIALFIWVYRREMGLVRIVVNGLIGFCMLGIVAVAIISYTEFGVLFDRLEETQFEGAIPDTRIESFRLVIEEIPNALLIGHGPRLRLIGDGPGDRYVEGRVVVPYPHNLYLFLLFTVGVAGLSAYMLFFILLGLRLYKASRFRARVRDRTYGGLPSLGMLLLIVFLVDQLKIEFLRAELADMQHYVFAVWAMFLAFSDGLRHEVASARQRPLAAAFAGR